MKRLTIAIFALLIAVPVFGQDRHQSYVTYDDGDSVLVQNDGREVDLRINLPVYPGDEVRAAKRGRTEIRLADGNVVAVDRLSRLRFESMLASFDGDDSMTVATLLEGQVIVYRLHRGSEPLRLDTANASYLSAKESLYGVETNSRGVDIVTVFEGSIEVRTPAGAVTLREGDQAKVDLTGVYSRNKLVKSGATEFEQWFIRRASRYSAGESRYLDSSLAYVERELSDNGRWIYVNEYSGHVWRPYVSVGWRPYYNGYWHVGFGGSMVWVSHEPWGWVPYHYGRWAQHPYHGWVWLPGTGYAPAWVYWVWGPSWVAWVPAGWYDCYWGYRSWHYYPTYYRHYGYQRGYGFQGRVTISSRDLQAYTVVDRKGLFSNRVDRASLTADEVKTRLARDGNRGVLSNQGVRVSNDEMRDPSRVAERIIRGGNGSGTGTSQGSGSPADVTQFFQRDPNPSATVRDRVTRGVPRDTPATATRGTASTAPGASQDRPGVVTRGGTASDGPTGGTVTRGGTTGQTTTRPTPATGTRSDGGTTPATTPREGVVRPRTGETPAPSTGTRSNDGSAEPRSRPVARPAPAPGTRTGTGASETVRPRAVPRPEPAKPSETRQAPAKDPEPEPRTQSRPVRPATRAPASSDTTAANDDWRRDRAGSTDPAQRVIGAIGGARITPGGADRSDSSSSTPRTAPATRTGDSSPDSWRSRGSFTSGSSSEGSTSAGSSGTTRAPSSVNRPTAPSSTPSSRGTTVTRPAPSGSGSSTSTRSSGSSSSSGGSGRAGMTRPSSSGNSSGSASSGSSSDSRSSSTSSGGGSKSSGSRSSGSSSSGKVSRNPD